MLGVCGEELFLLLPALSLQRAYSCPAEDTGQGAIVYAYVLFLHKFLEEVTEVEPIMQGHYLFPHPMSVLQDRCLLVLPCKKQTAHFRLYLFMSLYICCLEILNLDALLVTNFSPQIISLSIILKHFWHTVHYFFSIVNDNC